MKNTVSRNNKISLVLTDLGRKELQKQIEQIRNELLPALAPLITSNERDERDVAEFTRLTEEADSLEALISEAGKPDLLLDDKSIRLGSVVKVQTEKETFKIRMVHPVEAHLDDERISVFSPLGQSLFGNKKGDRVTVIAPSGNWSALIKSVEILP
jgi:transcription elongation GreA/GreB family factor